MDNAARGTSGTLNRVMLRHRDPFAPMLAA